MPRHDALDCLRTAVASFGPRVAVEDDHESLTYEELGSAIRRRAGEIGAELRTGGWFIQPSTAVITSIVDFFACLSCDLTPVLGDPGWSSAQVSSALEAMGAELSARSVLVWPRSPKPIPRAMFIRFSSGSSGTPKALLFSEQAMARIADAWASAADFRESDRVLCFAAINNGLAFNTSILAVLKRGARVRFASPRTLPTAALRLMAELKPSILVAFPLIYGLLAERDPNVLSERTRGLRCAISAAAALAPAVAQRWHTATGLSIGNYFGAAEVGPVTFNDGADREGLGQALAGVRLECTAPQGQLHVWTPWMAWGYVTEWVSGLSGFDPALPLPLADTGYLDGDACLRLTGRVNRVLNLNGAKVDAASMESELGRALGGIAVVVTLEERGESILVAHVESSRLTETEVRQACRQTVPPLPIPRIVRLYPHLPRSSAGKVMMDCLR